MATARDARSFEFGGFRLDAAQRRLVGPDGVPIDLPSRAFDLLLYFVERPGLLLDKSSLLKAVWPTTIVEETSLTQCIFVLRRALGEGAGGAKFITTIPGRGYQFVAQMRTAPSPDPSPGATTAGTTASDAASRAQPNPRRRTLAIAASLTILLALAGYLFWTRSAAVPDTSGGDGSRGSLKSIAILPFADLTPGKDMEFFGDGLAEELMSALGKLNGLQVAGRRSAFTFKDKNEDVRKIGDALNVESVLEGSVRREGDRLRISAQLSRASDGYSLWTETYDRKMDDLLDIQGAIAKEVARALNPLFDADQTIASRISTIDPEAYASYLRGVFFYGKLEIERARDEFLRATQLDPRFAMAFAQLARCYESFAKYSWENNATFMTEADKAIGQALKLDPSLQDVWWIHSIRKRASAGPRENARLLEHAIAANPSDADAMYHLGLTYTLLGRRDEGLAILERAYRTDPMWAATTYALAYLTYSFKSDRQRFLDLTDAMERIDPASSGPLHMRADLAFYEGRPLDWDGYRAKLIEKQPRYADMHAYLAREFAILGVSDASSYHAGVARTLAKPNPNVARNLAYIELFSRGNITGARAIVDEVQKRQPNDLFALHARAELQYFMGNCAGVLESQLRAEPSLGAPAQALDVSAVSGGWDVLTLHMWCLRQQAKHSRLAEVVEVWDVAFAPPTTSDVDVVRARAMAARGDRQGLLDNLRRLVNGKSPATPFSRFEPMIQPWLQDAEVSALLAALDARRAEWRRILPKASMRVPIPDAPKDPG